MSAPSPAPMPERSSTSVARARSFLLWAFLISIVIHTLALPFLRLKAQEEQKPQTKIVDVRKRVPPRIPTPPPPTPTPPPPTPPPKSTPPPVKQTNPPPVQRLKVNPPKTKSDSKSGPSVAKYVPPKVGGEDGAVNGNAATGAPAPVAATGPPATPAPPPTATPTPKPACAVPNKDAAIKGQAADADYPEIAKEQGAVGTAVVKVTLSADGAVSATSINKSAGNAALDQSAIAAAKATSYNAETVNCVPTAGSYLFQVDFTGQ